MRDEFEWFVRQVERDERDEYHERRRRERRDRDEEREERRQQREGMRGCDRSLSDSDAGSDSPLRRRRPEPKPKGRSIRVQCKPGLKDPGLRVILRMLDIRYRALGPALGADTYSLTVTKPSVKRALTLLNSRHDIILATWDVR